MHLAGVGGYVIEGVLGVHCASAEAEGGGGHICSGTEKEGSRTEQASAKEEWSCEQGKHVPFLSVLNNIIHCINSVFA